MDCSALRLWRSCASKASLEDGKDAEDGLIGTVSWCAPELLRVPRLYSQQGQSLSETSLAYYWTGDVFALALVVYECLSRQELGSSYPRQDGCHDFADFTSSGSRPSLESLELEHTAFLCGAISVAWAQQPEQRGTATNLVDALIASVPLCVSVTEQPQTIDRSDHVHARANTVFFEPLNDFVLLMN